MIMKLPRRKMMLTETTTTTAAVVADSCLLDCEPLLNADGICHGSCFSVCPGTCKFLLIEDDDSNLLPFFSQPPPLQPPPAARLPVFPSLIPDAHKKNLIITSMAVMASIIGVVLLVLVLFLLLRIFRSRRRRSLSLSSWRRDEDLITTVDAFAIDGDREPVIDHPIWYIRTIGLDQSVIESITVFRYDKSDKLIDGTDCSVCLSEFEQDETLRLLPKCSHAFHIPCIDTWLRSHTNCPLCRAPIISTAAVVAGSSQEEEESHIENSDEISSTSSQTASEETNGSASSSSRSNEEVEFSELPKPLTVGVRNHSHSRVQSDVLEGGRQQGELQAVRRSVSLDSSSAMAIYSFVANMGKNLDISSREMKRSNSLKRGSLSFRKLIKSGSMAGLLKKEPVSMKRSVSSSGKASTSRHVSRSHDSILPL